MKEIFHTIEKPAPVAVPPVRKAEGVIHPGHYNNGNMECIEEMVLVFGPDAVKDFCRLNVWKYRYRANEKNGENDLEKANNYMNILQELDMRF